MSCRGGTDRVGNVGRTEMSGRAPAIGGRTAGPELYGASGTDSGIRLHGQLYRRYYFHGDRIPYRTANSIGGRYKVFGICSGRRSG